jgi:hypothetical protein
MDLPTNCCNNTQGLRRSKGAHRPKRNPNVPVVLRLPHALALGEISGWRVARGGCRNLRRCCDSPGAPQTSVLCAFSPGHQHYIWIVDDHSH